MRHRWFQRVPISFSLAKARQSHSSTYMILFADSGTNVWTSCPWSLLLSQLRVKLRGSWNWRVMRSSLIIVRTSILFKATIRQRRRDSRLSYRYLPACLIGDRRQHYWRFPSVFARNDTIVKLRRLSCCRRCLVTTVTSSPKRHHATCYPITLSTSRTQAEVTYQQRVFKWYHSDKHFSEFYLQDGGKNQLA